MKTEIKDHKLYSYNTTKLTPIEPENISTDNLVNGLNFIYTEGEYELIPNFENESIINSGVSHAFDPEAIARRADHYAIQFSGYIYIAEDGLYNFATRSDDGSNLYIGGELVVDNDGSHSEITKDGIILLKQGYHKFRLDYFEDYMGQSLSVMVGLEDEDMTALEFDQLYRNADS